MNGVVRILVPLTLVACSSASESARQEAEPRRETALDSVVTIDTVDHPVPEVVRLDTVLDLQRRRVNIEENVSLYVAEEGTGPVLVLINGGPGNTLHSFLPHFSRANSFATILYYDQRGTGQSAWNPGAGPYSTSQAVDDLERLRSALDLDEWFVLGHSYGGVIAQWYAMRYPHRVRGMILVGSSVPIDGLDLGERDYRSAGERARIREAYAIDGQAVVPVHGGAVDLVSLRRMLYNGYLNGDWKRQYFFKPGRERMAQIARLEWVHDRDFNVQMRRDGFSRDLREVFLRAPIPTLIIEGAQDANWGPEKPRLFARHHPLAQLVVLDSAAHYPFSERPAAFFGALSEFMRRAPAVPDDAIERWIDVITELENDNATR
ncbi:MAG: alpha/beta hydrolase [Gemmatimonadota bacterium]